MCDTNNFCNLPSVFAISDLGALMATNVIEPLMISGYFMNMAAPNSSRIINRKKNISFPDQPMRIIVQQFLHFIADQ